MRPVRRLPSGRQAVRSRPVGGHAPTLAVFGDTEDLADGHLGRHPVGLVAVHHAFEPRPVAGVVDPPELFPQFFFLKASSTCFLMSPKFLSSSSFSCLVRTRNGTRTRLFANFTLSQYWPYVIPPGTGK